MRLSVLGLCAALAACSGTPPAVGPTCGADETACGSVCAKLRTDDAHCGSCAVACGATEACANSACFPRDCSAMNCAPDQVCASDQCLDKSCVGVLCPSGQTCSGGTCSCASPSRTCGPACVDPRLDDTNCGGCQVSCAASEHCAAGACLPQDCAQADCDPLSVCYQGSCTERACVGVVCPSGQRCLAGSCGCSSSELQCPAGCANPNTDSANCGACGHTCGAAERCAARQCLPKDCANTTCDPLSVCFQGGCEEAVCVGVACSGGQVCRAGLCQCPPGQTDCQGNCRALSTDAQHCGQCGAACAAGQSCEGGACVANTCPTGQTKCAGACVDLQTNADHCNACGAACGGGRNCVGGVCSCPSGLTYCGSTCVNLGTDGDHCGACGRSCAGGSCGAGVCACPSGLTLCGGSCVATATDGTNCGACGRVCNPGQTCSTGACGCPAGSTLCGGACLPTQSDNLNCGQCGRVCGVMTYCSGGACVPPFTCQTNYNQAPAGCGLFPLDLAKCGVSGAATTTGPFTGTFTASGQSMAFPFTMSASERVRVSNVISGGANATDTIRSNWPADLAYSQDATTAATPKTVVLTANGSPYACAHPVDARVLAAVSSPLNYSVSIDRIAVSGKFNTGGTTITNGPQLATVATDAGTPVVCDQVCGYAGKICPDNSDDRQYYRTTIPARRALVLDIALTGGNLHFVALQGNGNQICNLVNNVAPGPTYSFYKARLVNNTDVDQPVVLFPWLWASGTVTYQFVAGIE